MRLHPSKELNWCIFTLLSIVVCADHLVSSLFGPLSFEDIDVLAALEDCIANCRHEEVARVSRNVNELLDKMLISFMVKIWWVVGLTFSFLFFSPPHRSCKLRECQAVNYGLGSHPCIMKIDFIFALSRITCFMNSLSPPSLCHLRQYCQHF